MKSSEFIKETVCKLDKQPFEQLRRSLISKYLSFSIINEYMVTRDILAEKLCDYFITVEEKTGNSFDKQILIFLKDLDSIVGSWIEKPKPSRMKKDSEPVQQPRSRKYYERALMYLYGKEPWGNKVFDCSRLLFSLYMEIINEDHKVISNFNYSLDSLDPQKIISAMENEETSKGLSREKKKRFDTKDPYSSDTCTLIMASIILFYLANNRA